MMKRRGQIFIVATLLAIACLLLTLRRFSSQLNTEKVLKHDDGVDELGNPLHRGAGTSNTNLKTAIAITQSTSLLPVPSPEAGDHKWLQEAPRYIRAIMNPEDDSFSRLSCPAPNGSRYGYLQSTKSLESNQLQGRPKYFFALNLHQCAPILPRLLGSVVETILFLGSENCALSVVEGRSDDGTFEVLISLREEMERIGAKYFLGRSNVNPLEEGGNRIKALAELRNQALQPLTESSGGHVPDNTVIFVNDVSLCMEDLLELIHQRIYQNADMVCAIDWIFGGSSFYDVWISRGMNGDLFFEIPQSGSWDFSGNLFWDDPKTRDLLDAKLPFQAFACWNGATAFTATPLSLHQVSFRSSYKGECLMGEPTLFCKDLWHTGYGRIAVVPSVNIGYNDEESKAVKSRHGYVSEWVRKKEKETETEIRSDLVNW
jgi:alpha-1,3-mannosyltransferase